MRHPGWYRQRLAPLETAIVFTIVCMMLMFCVSAAPSLLSKARLGEVLLLLGDARVDSMVGIAMRGGLQDDQIWHAKQDHNHWTTGGIHYQRHGSTTVARGNLFAKQAHSATNSLRARMPDITLTMRPAIAAQAPMWSVMWLCGDHPTPPGWIAADHPSQSSLSTAPSTHMCRDLPQ